MTYSYKNVRFSLQHCSVFTRRWESQSYRAHAAAETTFSAALSFQNPHEPPVQPLVALLLSHEGKEKSQKQDLSLKNYKEQHILCCFTMTAYNRYDLKFVSWKAVTTNVINIINITHFSKVGIKFWNTERMATRMMCLNTVISSVRLPTDGITTTTSFKKVSTGQDVCEPILNVGLLVITRFSAPIQASPGAHLASYTMGTASLSLGVKRPGRGLDHPPPSCAEVKERPELYLYSPPWAFMACSKTNFTSPYISHYNASNRSKITKPI